MWRVLDLIFLFLVFFLLVALVAGVIPITEAEYTTRYLAYQAGETARQLAEQETARVQAAQWGETLRVWATWSSGALAVVAAAAAAAWVIIQWQRERTARHVVSAQAQVCIAYIAAFGGRMGRLGSREGVYLEAPDGGREFVPWQIAEAELEQIAEAELELLSETRLLEMRRQ